MTPKEILTSPVDILLVFLMLFLTTTIGYGLLSILRPRKIARVNRAQLVWFFGEDLWKETHRFHYTKWRKWLHPDFDIEAEPYGYPEIRIVGGAVLFFSLVSITVAALAIVNPN